MNQPILSLKDFTSDQEVRWCPGCGDYAILKTVQKLLPTLGRPRENHVFVSGIGCSSRFPYYMNTYGFHTIHGRAPAIATGVKLANPELDVWVITGDGDGFSIGGNHMMHTLRRNVDLQLLVFNNEIYGLTKGQYSPTSKLGTRSPSSPGGSIDPPLSPCAVALGAGGGFIARSIDTHAKHLSAVIGAGHAHTGTAFIEILQNCPIYNDGIFESVKDRRLAADFRVEVEHGKPVVFGKNNEKAIRLNRESLALEVVPATADDVLVHDESNPVLANLLAAMGGPGFPIAIGILHRRPGPSFEAEFHQHRMGASRGGNLAALLRSGNTWVVD